MSIIGRSLLSRLHHDLTELLDLPYPGVDVFIDDANLRKLCLVLTPPSGPWKDLSLHFDVELPSTWPSSPPRVRSSVMGIQHPNLFGDWICCDLLKEQSQLEKGYTGGYTPALTLRGLFLQFLTFFSSTKVEQDYGGQPIYIGDYLLVRYAREEHLANFSLQADHYYRRSYLEPEDEQLKLEKLWKSNTSSEIIMDDYTEDRWRARHSVKNISSDRLHRVERVNPRWQTTYDRISKWCCKSCPYGSDKFPICRNVEGGAIDSDKPPTPAFLNPSSACFLNILNDDVLLDLAYHLPSESLISFSTAYPRFHALISSVRMLLQKELRCFFLRTSWRESILGIGISLDPKSRTLSSDFDWLSKEAFDKHGVRKSIQKRDFDYFLPLSFNRPHFNRAASDIWVRLTKLDEAIRNVEKGFKQKNGKTSKQVAPSPRRKPHEVVDVVYKMMNNIVVTLMMSCDDVLKLASNDYRSTQTTLLYASEKAVISYCHLFHLLLCLGRSVPAVLGDAANRLQCFIQFPASRIKTENPDLGELIVLITLVLILPPSGKAPTTWTVFNGPFLEEAIIRNVRWVLRDQPDLEVLESGPSEYRLQNTFDKSKTSLRLIMFQITFLNIFIKTYASNISRLDDNYGFPDHEIPVRMVEEFKEIYKVDSWPKFFERAQYTRGMQFGKEKFSDMLRAAVRTSGQRRYHTPKSARDLHALSRDREACEGEWLKARSSRSR